MMKRWIYKGISILLSILFLTSFGVSFNPSSNGHFLQFGQVVSAASGGAINTAPWEDVCNLQGTQTVTLDQAHYIYMGSAINTSISTPALGGWTNVFNRYPTMVISTGTLSNCGGYSQISENGSFALSCNSPYYISIKRLKLPPDISSMGGGSFTNGQTYTFSKGYVYFGIIHDSSVSSGAGAVDLFGTGYKKVLSLGYNDYGVNLQYTPMGTYIDFVGTVTFSLSPTQTLYISKIPINNNPIVSVTTPTQNGTFNESAPFKPSINVSDPDNDSLTCKYYVDTETSPRETKTVTNTSTLQAAIFSQVDFTSLAEGNHTIKFEVNDGTVSTTQSVNFKFDKTPILSTITSSSSNKTITLQGSASDTGSGLSSSPYGFSIDSNPTVWKSPDLVPGNSTVVNSIFDISGNGGNKVTRLSNGWIVVSAYTELAGAYYKLYYYVSKDNGATWNQLCYCDTQSNNIWALSSSGTSIYTVLTNTSSNELWFTKFDALTISGSTSLVPNKISTGLVNMGKPSIVVDPVSGTIHAAWSGRNSAYTPIYNIYYSKSTDGGNTWSSPVDITKITTGGDYYSNPCIVLRKNGLPIIFYQQNGLGRIWCNKYDAATGWYSSGREQMVYEGGTYAQANPTAIVSENGSIHLTWQGKDAIDSSKFNIHYMKSTNDGVTWTKQDGTTGDDKLTSGNLFDQQNPSVSVDKNSNIYIEFQGRSTGTCDQIRKIVNNGTWGNILDITTNTTSSAANPQTISNINGSNDPLCIYQDYQAGAIKFLGVLSSVNASHTFDNLTPGKKYAVSFQAKDNTGNISTWTKDVYTKADKPILTQGNKTRTTLELISTDENSPETRFMITTGTKYVSQNGELSDSPQWITLSDKKVLVTGLQANVKYSFSAKARNGENIETDSSTVLDSITLPNPPAVPKGLKATSGSNKITLTWGSVTGVTGYDLEVDGILIENLKATTYSHSNLTPYAKHTYRVRSRNDGGPCNWSQAVAAYTLVGKTINILNTPTGTAIKLSWDAVPGATAYDVEVDGEIRTLGNVTSFTNSGLTPSSQHTYRVRAKNILGPGDWSELLTLLTTDGIPSVAPTNIIATASNTMLTLTWKDVIDAQNYDIVEVVDGQEVQLVEDWDGSTFEKKGLQPNSQHTYKIRGKNVNGTGPWSEPVTVTTFLLDTPQNVKAEKTENSVKLTWDSVTGADSYDVYQNDQLLKTVSSPVCQSTGLTPETKYVYKIKARNASGESEWSREMIAITLPVKPGVPANVNASVGQKVIIITWDSVTGAEGYDVELDGVVLENDNTTKYIHNELEPFAQHSYRVRARNMAIEGDWSPLQYIKTLPMKPAAPQNIAVKSTSTGATLTWGAVDSAFAYDIEVNDGTTTTVYENIMDTSFVHRKIGKGKECRYRIRSKNDIGISDWSGFIINNAIKAECKKKTSVDLGLTATDVVDFSKYTLIVTYNPGVIDVADLCELSGNAELAPGKVEGTDITITEFTPGRIVFTTDKAVNPGESWTGVINSIKFIAKVTGGTTITYTVICKPEE